MMYARNTLTQRVIGPVSSATVELHTAGLREGDEAGIGFLNVPYATLGVLRTADGLIIRRYNQADNSTVDLDTLSASTRTVQLRAYGTFDRDLGNFAWSADGETFSRSEEHTSELQSRI